MSERQPATTKNLDGYGNPPLEWSRVRDALAAQPAGPGRSYFLGSVRPDGRPHAAGIGAIHHDGDMYVVSGPGTQKSRNLDANPACTIAAGLDGLDVVLEGEATRVTDTDTLERVAAVYRDLGWPVNAEGDAFTAPYSAPSAGPPPWHLYRVVVSTVFGVASAEPHGATRWTF